jgi:hypothetical protein
VAGAAANWQQGAKSNSIAALNSGAETFAGISNCTGDQSSDSVAIRHYRHFDQVPTTNSADASST